MKPNKTLIAGLLCGAACALLVGAYTNQLTEENEQARAEALARYGGESLEVCVATRPLAVGETLDESAIETKLWLVDLLPPDAVVEKNAAIGEVVSSPILEGEVISSQRFATEAETLDVPAGKSALSVPAREVQAVGGALAKGMTVDIYATGASTTTLLAENVQVLASSSGTTGEEATTWITVAVPPESAEEMVAAAQNLQLYFVLPNDSGGTLSDNHTAQDKKETDVVEEKEEPDE